MRSQSSVNEVGDAAKGAYITDYMLPRGNVGSTTTQMRQRQSQRNFKNSL